MTFVDNAPKERESLSGIVDCKVTMSMRGIRFHALKRTLVLFTSFIEELLEIEPVLIREIGVGGRGIAGAGSGGNVHDFCSSNPI